MEEHQKKDAAKLKAEHDKQLAGELLKIQEKHLAKMFDEMETFVKSRG